MRDHVYSYQCDQPIIALRQTALKFRQVFPVFLVDSPQNRPRFHERFYPRPPKVDIPFPKLISRRDLLRLHLQNMLMIGFRSRFAQKKTRPIMDHMISGRTVEIIQVSL